MGIQLKFGIFGAPYTFGMTQSLSGVDNDILGILQKFDNADIQRGGKQMFITKLPNNGVLYSFCVGGDGKNFVTSAGRNGSWFGIAMVISGHQSTSNEMIYNFLDNIYEQYVLGKIILDNGKYKKHLLGADEFAGPRVGQYINTAAQNLINQNMLDINKMEPYQYRSPEKTIKYTHSAPMGKNKVNEFERAIKILEQNGITATEFAQYMSQQNTKK